MEKMQNILFLDIYGIMGLALEVGETKVGMYVEGQCVSIEVAVCFVSSWYVVFRIYVDSSLYMNVTVLVEIVDPVG